MQRRSNRTLVLAVDIGSSSTRSALFESSGSRLIQTAAHQPYSVHYGADGRAELSPFTLELAFRNCVSQTLRAHDKFSSIKKLPVSALGASSFWHGLLGLNRKLRPITPVFTWADSRAAEDAARLRSNLSERKIQTRTGCMLRSSFWPAKLLWLKRTQPELFGRVSYWVSPSDWILYRLFGPLGCSPSMASGTGLFNLKIHRWDEELLDICAVRTSSLPEITNEIKPGTRARFSIETVFSPIGDGAAGNLGSGADRHGVAAINIGTSAAVRIVQDRHEASRTRIPTGLFRYLIDPKLFVMGGAVSNAGNLREWCLRELRLENKPALLDRALPRKAAASDSLTVLPFWIKERAPTWPERQLGIVDNLEQSTTATKILRATTTSVFYRLAQILELLEEERGRSQEIIVSGGIVDSLPAIRILADALGRDIKVSGEREASLRGAAVHVLNQLGMQPDRPTHHRLIRFDSRLAEKHRQRRRRQIKLEALLEQPTKL